MNTLAMQGKNSQIQTIRGICMICVCFIHVIAKYNQLNPYIIITARTIVNFCVGLFFFISAYLVNIDKVKNNHKDYVFKRILHLYTPFFFYSLGYTILYQAYNFSTIKETCITIIKILIGSNAGHLYFIIILIIFTLLCPILVKAIESKNKILDALIISISPIYLLVAFIKKLDVNIFSIDDILPSYLVRVLPFTYLICYYLGLYFKINGFPKFNSLFLIPFTFFTALVGNIIEFYFLEFSLNYVTGQIKLLNIIFIFSIMINFDKILLIIKKFNTKLIEKIADSSFGIYFIHLLVIKILFRFMAMLKINYCYNDFTMIFNLIIVTAFTVFFSWFIIFILRKLIKNKFIKRILCVN